MSNEIIYQILMTSFAVLTISSALVVLFFNKIIYAAISLIISLLAIAGIFTLLGHDFLASTQIMVYVGGVLILIIFGIMLTKKTSDKKSLSTQKRHPLFGVLVGTSTLGGLSYLLFQSGKTTSLLPYKQGTKEIGKLLMTDYLLPLEIISILLLVVLIGSVYIASKIETDD